MDLALDLGFLTRSRVRLIRQTEVAECGLASLTMVANYHGFDVDLGTMRRRYSPSMRGAPLRALINLADDRRVTYRDLHQRSGHLAGALQKRGVEQGDRVAILALNGSFTSAARTPWKRFAAIDIPMPEPQIKIPLSASPFWSRFATRAAKSG